MKAFVPSCFIAATTCMEPAKQLYNIRHPMPEQCQAVIAFYNQYNVFGSTIHGLSLAQNMASSWVCLDIENSIMAVAVTWASPSAYGTAIIDGIAVANNVNQDALNQLLDTITTHWTRQCIRTLIAPASDPTSLLGKTIADKGFATCHSKGLSLLKKVLWPERICLQNKKMRPTMNTANGQVGEDTLFEYKQEGDYVWGTYSGGEVERGVLIGKMNVNRDIRFHYFQMDKNGNMFQGTSRSSTEFLNDGRIALYEDWEWTGNRTGSGSSIIEEIKE